MKTLSQRLRSSELLRASELLNEGQEPAAHAPDHISHLGAIFRKAAKRGVVLYARISDPRPGKRETTSDQLEVCDYELDVLVNKFVRTLKVHGTFAESGPGWGERPKLKQAAKLAKKHGAVLVAFDVSRFVRNEKYSESGQEPTVDDFDQLMKLVGNVQLATIAHPSIHEDRSSRVKSGIKKAKAAKNTYRKPYTKLPKKTARVVMLRNQGASWDKIAKTVGRAESTIRGWYAKEKAGGANFSK
jgi:DNA invertase Pin-like site-specific DNA recombinase